MIPSRRRAIDLCADQAEAPELAKCMRGASRGMEEP
jgi:hypothetical protein